MQTIYQCRKVVQKLRAGSTPKKFMKPTSLQP